MYNVWYTSVPWFSLATSHDFSAWFKPDLFIVFFCYVLFFFLFVFFFITRTMLKCFLHYLKPSFIPLSSASPFTNLLSSPFAPLSATAEVIIALSCREAVVSLLIYVIWEPVLASEREPGLDQRVYARLHPAPYGSDLLAPPVPSAVTHPPSLCWSHLMLRESSGGLR